MTRSEEGSGSSAETAELASRMRRLLLVSSRILRTRTSSEQISASQYSVLAFLDRSGSATPGAIAEFEHVSPPVMTRTLDRLETAGLVARAAHPGDGRQVLVTLTATGADLVHRGRQERDDWLSSRIEATDPAERDALDAAVDLLTRTLIERPAERFSGPLWTRPGIPAHIARSAGPLAGIASTTRTPADLPESPAPPTRQQACPSRR